MVDEIAKAFPAGTRVNVPEGGLVLWVELPESVDTLHLAERAAAEGIDIMPGPLFTLTDRFHNALRLNFAHWDARTRAALRRLSRVV